MSKKFNVAIVGLGFGAEFIPLWQKHPHTTCYAICQRDEKKLNAVGDYFGVEQRYQDFAALLDQKSPEATQAAAMGKRFATDAGFRVVNEALQLHGGYGYLKDFPLERYLRDLRVHQILEGTNEIMRVIISRRLLMS